MDDKTRLMLGNEAVARGLWEAGCRFVSSYPGTPSTEITEYAAGYDLYAEWAPNEKVAVEAAIGASLSGARSFSGMKHVGFNVAADPLFTAAYTGVNGGLVVAVADDPGMHSSQNEQDSRHYARSAKLPMLWPSDSAECKAFTKEAFSLSERFDTPVLLSLSTRVSHSRSAAEIADPEQVPPRPYRRDVAKYVMTPAMARGRHVEVERRLLALRGWAEASPLNQIEWGDDRKIGVITGGIAYQTAREALGNRVSYLKLGIVWPLPDALLREFVAGLDTVYVIEELDDFIEAYCHSLGLGVKGKELFSLLGEYTPGQIRSALSGDMPAGPGMQDPESGSPNATCDVDPDVDADADIDNLQLPVRPPVLCPGCPHRGLFYVLNKMKLTVLGDIGCYTLAASPPLSAIDLCVCMGASVSSLHGFVTANPEMASRTVAVIGDSTFYHSGITGLVNIVYNQSPATVLILDNATTGMTGHQQNPGTGLTLQNKPVPQVELEALCRGVGVGAARVRVVDPYDLAGTQRVLAEELEAPEPSVVIARRPCVLLPCVNRDDKYAIDSQACKKCHACMRIGCPSIRIAQHDEQGGQSNQSNQNGQGGQSGQKRREPVEIEASLCVGCGLCTRLCKFGAIQPAAAAQTASDWEK
ncbi:MAG: thiamine pyrophosphate-dependent enzyme [Oscillospiraceae bacterium]|nr:thiamine pyrophosphate-dependent enzyme [Oscillospiraceae bacterium]